MSLPITKSERQIVKHFLLYPTSDITLDAFHSEANCVGTSSWTPCEFADGAGEEDFEYDLERDGEGISDIRVYGLLRIIYYDLINNTSAFDATLLCGFYFWLVDDKPAIDNLADDRGRAALLMSYLLTITDGRVYWARTIVDAIEDATGWVRMVGANIQHFAYINKCNCFRQLKIGTKMSLPPAPSLLSSLFSRLTTLQWPLRELMEILEDLFLGHVRRALPAAPTAAPQRVVRAVKPEPGATGSKRVRQEVTENEDEGCVLPLLRIVIIVRNSMRSKECTQR
jgi:hypothetical protein